MDPFGDNFSAAPAATAQDAGANFLAQEQNELAALENQLLDAKITTTDEDLMGGDEDLLNNNDQQQTPVPVVEAADPADFFGANNVTETTPVTTENNMNGLNGLESVIENNNTNVDDDVVVLETSTQINPIISAPAYDIKVEPESLRKWREEFNQRIQEADAKEQALKDEWLAKAKQELDEWSLQRNEMLEKTKKANREAEQIFIEERESRSQEGGDADWTKVSDLCDFNPKTSKGSKDTSRMRSLFLHLAKAKK